ncbi:MAG: hypothetical protein HKM95_16510, partial [Inquilinus sp.]|nr:hypothetical protein [Inquilinus sp.]
MRSAPGDEFAAVMCASEQGTRPDWLAAVDESHLKGRSVAYRDPRPRRVMPGTERTTPVSHQAVDPQIFLDPLGFLRTELYRQRVACNTLEALASTDTNGDTRADAERVLRYIVEDVPVHTADLEECLFPLLAQRVLPADG